MSVAECAPAEADADAWEADPYTITVANVTAWSSAQRLLDACTTDVWLLQETRHAGAEAQAEVGFAPWASQSPL